MGRGRSADGGRGEEGGGKVGQGGRQHAPGNSQQAGQHRTDRRATGREQMAGFKSLEKTATNTSDKTITMVSVITTDKLLHNG